jgi:hypothetical protein
MEEGGRRGAKIGRVRVERRRGLPLYWTDAPEPFVGALIFRVGRSDENLRAGGITHLVEHLALSCIGRRRIEFNGHVEGSFVLFSAEGSRSDVAAFLQDVASSIDDLPVDRLAEQKEILRAEAETRPPGVVSHLLALRFGPCAHGLRFHRELGLGWLRGPDVVAWRDRCFGDGNGAAMLSGTPPEGFAIELRPVDPLPAVEPVPIPSLALPAQATVGEENAAVSVVAPRSLALNAGFAIAMERARQTLREGAALSYSPTAFYEPLDGRTAHAVLAADCRPQDSGRVRDGLLAILDDLAERGPTEEELEWDREMRRRADDDPNRPLGELDAHVRDTLWGVEPISLEQLSMERDDLVAADVAAAMADSLPSLLALVAGVPPPTTRLGEYSPERKDALQGQRYAPTAEWRAWRERSELVIGDEGFSYLQPDRGETTSWLYGECVAGVWTLSGNLEVVARDGSAVVLRPNRYERGQEAVDRVAEALGPERLVPLDDLEGRLAPLVAEQLADRAEHLDAEVDVLGAVLGSGEQLCHLAEASRNSPAGQQVGLLVLTDRRVLFLFLGSEIRHIVEERRDDVRLDVKGRFRKRLVIDGKDRTELRNIQPAARLEEIAAAQSRRA